MVPKEDEHEDQGDEGRDQGRDDEVSVDGDVSGEDQTKIASVVFELSRAFRGAD